MKRSEDSDGCNAFLPQFVSEGVSDVDQRNVHSINNMVEHTVHGVAGNDDSFGAASLQRPGRMGEPGSDGRPIVGLLQRLNLGEIEAVEKDSR